MHPKKSKILRFRASFPLQIWSEKFQKQRFLDFFFLPRPRSAGYKGALKTLRVFRTQPIYFLLPPVRGVMGFKVSKLLTNNRFKVITPLNRSTMLTKMCSENWYLQRLRRYMRFLCFSRVFWKLTTWRRFNLIGACWLGRGSHENSKTGRQILLALKLTELRAFEFGSKWTKWTKKSWFFFLSDAFAVVSPQTVQEFHQSFLVKYSLMLIVLFKFNNWIYKNYKKGMSEGSSLNSENFQWMHVWG